MTEEAMTRPNMSIPSSLWNEVRVVAFRRGVRPVEVVIECLREKFTEGPKEAGKQVKVKSEVVGGLRAGGNDGDAQSGGSIPHSKTVKTTLDVVSESKNPAPSPQTKRLVVSGLPLEPEFVCKACGKPTDGEYLCKNCK